MDHGRSMKMAGVFFLLLVLLELPLSAVIDMVQRACPKEYGTLVSLVLTQAYLLSGAVIYIRVAGLPRGKLGFHAFRPQSLVGMLLLLLTSGTVAQWLNLFSQLFVKNEAADRVSKITQVLPMWAGILLIGFLPGIVEELIYRGILYSMFRNRSMVAGVAVSALCFGLMHMNLNQIAYAVFMGVLFALVVEATGSLFSSMLMHAAFNIFNVVLLYRSAELATAGGQELGEQSAIKEQIPRLLVSMTPIALLGLFLTVWLLKNLARINGRSLSDGSRKGTGKVLSLPLIAGWAVCLLLALVSMIL